MKIKIINEAKINYGLGPYFVSIKRLEELFRFFHLSSNQLHKNAKTFTFNPRVPKSPFEDDDYKVIEDNFTPRISLATKITDAIDALNVKKGKFYVYACDIESRLDDDINAIPLNITIQKCKEEQNVGPEYGQDYKLDQFIDKYADDIKKKLKISHPPHGRIYSPNQLPPKLKKKWTGCVPDAELTNEYWSIKDTKMYYIGIIATGDTHVKLSWQGKEILNKIEKEESSS